ncbi:hypothetical protein EHS25_004015 [Saitozyma podzolica]|uniref:Major facilitator superfamily (MFS) profile domain-containing protein n=1 Tax=Saitozyma podzolica TaxID=1890683 RepID=A0A427YT01_9TREE|nr:hypothetical protein EHS25_004015 [Saitozyma podzolica]
MSSIEKIIDVDYTPEEEKKAVRKVDFFVLPVVILCFLMLQFDRTNLGNAQTDGFATALKITTTQINLGQTLFTLGIVLLELPSNVVAKALGPNRWIPVIMLIWGVVTLCQAFLKDASGFYATRFLLAAGEAGFIPGMAWYLTRFYTNGELSLRLALYWSANSMAGMVAGPLALGILSGLTGRNGWHGWQYLFLIEGLMTIVVAIFAFLVLPAAPMDGGRSPVGRIMSSREAEILAARAIRDDPKKAFPRGTKVALADVLDTFKDWRLYGHCAAALLSSVVLTPINTYGPSVIKSLGYTGYTANGMQAPGSAIGLIVSVALAWHSDRARERGLHIALAMALSCAGCLWLALAPSTVGKNVLYGGYLMTAGTMGTGQAINASWLSSKFDERRRPIALACYVMSIQIAGFAGSNVFQANDAPRYTHGLTICGACAIAGAVVMVAWKFLYMWDDKRAASSQVDVPEPVSLSRDEITEKGSQSEIATKLDA